MEDSEDPIDIFKGPITSCEYFDQDKLLIGISKKPIDLRKHESYFCLTENKIK